MPAAFRRDTPTADRHPGAEQWLLALGRLVNNRCGSSTGVIGRECQRLLQTVGAAAYAHNDRTLAFRLLTLQIAHRASRPVQRGEGLRDRARTCVTPVRRNHEIGCTRRASFESGPETNTYDYQPNNSPLHILGLPLPFYAPHGIRAVPAVSFIFSHERLRSRTIAVRQGK